MSALACWHLLTACWHIADIKLQQAKCPITCSPAHMCMHAGGQAGGRAGRPTHSAFIRGWRSNMRAGSVPVSCALDTSLRQVQPPSHTSLRGAPVIGCSTRSGGRAHIKSTSKRPQSQEHAAAAAVGTHRLASVGNPPSCHACGMGSGGSRGCSVARARVRMLRLLSLPPVAVPLLSDNNCACSVLGLQGALLTTSALRVRKPLAHTAGSGPLTAIRRVSSRNAGSVSGPLPQLGGRVVGWSMAVRCSDSSCGRAPAAISGSPAPSWGSATVSLVGEVGVVGWKLGHYAAAGCSGH